MRSAVLLSIVAAVLAACGQSSKPKAAKPKAATAPPTRPAAVTPKVWVEMPRVQDDAPRYSRLDEVANTAAEIARLSPEPTSPAKVIEPPAWAVG